MYSQIYIKIHTIRTAAYAGLLFHVSMCADKFHIVFSPLRRQELAELGQHRDDTDKPILINNNICNEMCLHCPDVLA